VYALKGVPGVRIPLSPPYIMTAGPRGTTDCELRQIWKEAAAAISAFATGSPAVSF